MGTQCVVKVKSRTLLYIERWSPRFLVSVVKGRSASSRWRGVADIDPRSDHDRSLWMLGGCRFACGDSSKSSGNDHFEYRTQMGTTCDDDASTYLGECPQESGTYTEGYVATISYLCKGANSKTTDHDVARLPSARFPGGSRAESRTER